MYAFGYEYNDPKWLSKYNIVLDRDDNGNYAPIHYAIENENGELDWVVVIDEGDIIFDWITYIKLAFKDKDKVTRETVYGNLFSYQWGASINIINTVMAFQSKMIDIEWSRQTGKSFLLEHMNSFLTIFAPRYKRDLVGEKWTTITASYKDDSAKKNFKGVRAKIKNKAIPIYNDIYGNSNHKLVYGKYKVGDESKTISDTTSHLEIDVIQGTTSQGWSQIYALSTNTDQDGYSSCLNYVDEGILVNADEYMRSIDPFTTANSACTIVTGIASVDSSSLQYLVHYDTKSIKYIMPWEEAYTMKKAINPVEAEIFKQSVLAKIDLNGGVNSTKVQTNYYMSWEITDGKFTTREQLRRNNVFQSDIEKPNINADYIVAGLDLSNVGDYMVLTIMEAYKYIEYNDLGEEIENWSYMVKEIKTYNLDKKRMDSEKTADKVALDCLNNCVDMLMIDGTGTQGSQVEYIYKAVRKKNLSTLCVPYAFSGAQNKVLMMSNLEASMFSGKLKLPKEEYKSENKSFSLLYDELIALRKYAPKGGGNTKYEASTGGNVTTDDHCMSLALGAYCIPYIKLMKSKGKNKKIEIGTTKTKFKLVKFEVLDGTIIKERKLPRTYMTIL